jgi:uncharacterized Fe-S cluster-containing protein
LSEIGLKLRVRDARKLAAALTSTEFSAVAQELNAKLDEYDGKRRECEERRKRELVAQREQEARRAACEREGHLEARYDEHLSMLDASTLSNVLVEIPSCPRCGESLVILADGSVKEWLGWTQTKEPLHHSMRIIQRNEEDPHENHQDSERSRKTAPTAFHPS